MTSKKTTQSAAGKPVAKGDHVYLIDASGYIFRAYHALPPLTRPSDGLPVGAVHGFCGMLWKLLRETGELDPPTHLAAIFDLSEHTFRNDLFSDYKANRSEAPEDLIPQFPLIRDAVHAFNVACIEKRGYEADDLIATYALQAREAGADVTIVSSDKDLMQLVRPGIRMYDTMKNKVIGEAEVVEKFGVPPSKVIEVQALIGDTSDNVPGVPGIGVKTAALLINEYGDLETLLMRAAEIKQQKRRENLIAFAEQARLSRTLVTLDCETPLDVPLAETAVHVPDPNVLTAFMRHMEFSTLLRRVAEGLGAELPEGEAKPSTTPRKKKDDYDHPLRKSPRGEAGPARDTPVQGGSPAELAIERAGRLEDVPFDRANYETVTETERLADLLEAARFQGHFAFRAKLSAADPMTGEIAGVALALIPGHAAYVPLGHSAGDELGLGGETVVAQIPLREALDLLKPILEDEAVLKIVSNAKPDMVALARYGIQLMAIDDPCLMSYALDAGRAEHLPPKLAGSLLGYTCLTEKEVMGTGKAAVGFDRVAVERAAEYAGEEVDIALRLWMVLKPRLAAESVTTVYETLERPLQSVLASMERAGVKVERSTLASLSGAFAQTIARLEDEIRELAGEEFNIGSPKQLGEILFDKMSLPGGRRTKTGAWSTDAAALEELAAEGHDLPRKVLDWRLVAKLKSTYTDALPAYIHAETGRVHTRYVLASTTTGRLASQEPNLQNIPVRTKEGRSIRKAFVAEKGKKLISADYSQIELRVLAHMADTPTLRQAFADGLDIHAMTASEMFGVPIAGMDPGIRRRAKAINFGIIYGISAVGLAAQLGIPRGEAATYIKTYFERFPGIKDYMEAMKAEARRTGYVKTLFGRKVHYPEINTKNPSLRGNYERAAINAPIQGTAADIIRRAMIRMADALDEAGLSARMLLQVHDELIFEAPEDEADKTMEIAQSVMERAPEPALKLKVPLQVDARAADNWEAAH
ncbi:DNA polymerase I [Methyloceanibacter marginalis]|uniref:DNA polymerase I n=1 Tax=Methyloceanibacter marginalis TaxID=1774971 RepID=A0A1E3WDZ5_9HYPH|nr:DNA polymerase I [Methyloceanibacter marginalis]ODS04045.1 DNA polymerase I [Methyloceanibacter marginalis]